VPHIPPSATDAYNVLWGASDALMTVRAELAEHLLLRLERDPAFMAAVEAYGQAAPDRDQPGSLAILLQHFRTASSACDAAAEAYGHARGRGQ
jgi:hypothetical protein